MLAAVFADLSSLYPLLYTLSGTRNWIRKKSDRISHKGTQKGITVHYPYTSPPTFKDSVFLVFLTVRQCFQFHNGGKNIHLCHRLFSVLCFLQLEKRRPQCRGGVLETGYTGFRKGCGLRCSKQGKAISSTIEACPSQMSGRSKGWMSSHPGSWATSIALLLASAHTSDKGHLSIMDTWLSLILTVLPPNNGNTSK